MQIRRMRKLREKYNIPISLLAQLSTVNRQRFTQIELADNHRPTQHMQNIVESAFAKVIEQRRRELDGLEADYQRYRGHLLDYTDGEEMQ